MCVFVNNTHVPVLGYVCDAEVSAVDVFGVHCAR